MSADHEAPPVEPSPELIRELLAARGLTDVPAETLAELPGAVQDLWALGREVTAGLAALDREATGHA